MKDEGKTKKQFISEVVELRQWVAALNATETSAVSLSPHAIAQKDEKSVTNRALKWILAISESRVVDQYLFFSVDSALNKGVY